MIVGVVPCAGASERMGRPKALLQAEGKTFVQSVVDALRDGGCDSVVVVVSSDERIRAEAARTGATVVTNKAPGEGPITSLRLALASLPDGTRGIVYLPVDHPFVSAETVRRLLGAARDAGSDLVIPTLAGKRGHPAFFGTPLFDELADPALQGGARTVVHKHLHAATLLAVDDEGIRMDLDTPEAYAAAISSGDAG